MLSPLQSELESWTLPIPVTGALVITAFVYLRGWLRLRRTSPNVIRPWQLVAFLCGLMFAWIAVGSPLAALDDDLLTVHMVQHILLMTVAPPLILLGAPVIPFLHAFAQSFVLDSVGPVLRWPILHRVGRFLTHPVFAWLSATVALMGWHIPALFDLALRSQRWHEAEHASFLATGMLFWWPVIQPWPSVARWPRWSIPGYLFLATLPCDALSAFLAFCGRVMYSSYNVAPRVWSLSPLQDQECAGALMWTCATFIYLIPAAVITIQLLSPSPAQFDDVNSAPRHEAASTAPAATVDAR